MSFGAEDVVVREVDARFWELVVPITYDGNADSFSVPAGFQTDFASVPRPLVWLLPRYGAYTKSAILHDFLCTTAVVSRADADGLFRRSMRELGVPFVRRWMMWAAVRLASRLSNAGPREVAIWLVAAIPSLAFVLVPGLVILFWLFLFWLVELIFYLALRPVSKQPVHRPRLSVSTST
jgi:Protein of unknown function (DUF1353)